MFNFFDAIRFLLNLQFGKESSLLETVSLGKTRKFETDIYRPKGKSKGTIITINGLAPLGPKDPRFVKVNEALVKIGYTVVSPFLKEICEFKISKQNITDIVLLVESVVTDEKYSLPKNIGVFAPSFSGGLSLIAACDPKISHSIQSMMLIGSYSKVDELISYLFRTQETDEYGRLILLWNFMFLSLGEKPKLKKALELTILDNYFKRSPGELEVYWNQLSKSDKRIFLQVKEDPKFRMDLWESIVKKGGSFVNLLSDLNVHGKLKNIKSPVALVHGKNDDVVPSSQSIKVFEELNMVQIPSKLCITNLLGHGDTGFSAKSIWEVFPLLSTFSFFFLNLRKKRRL